MIGIAASFGVVSTVAFGQTGGLQPAQNQALQVTVEADAPPHAQRPSVPDEDLNRLRNVFGAARMGDVENAQAMAKDIQSPVARKLARWMLVDSRGDLVGFAELTAAERDLAGWPRPGRRRQFAEDSLETAGLDPSAVIGFFADQPPKTARGAMALAAADQATGHPADAQTLIRQTWRTMAFDADTQKSLLARFGSLLTSDDHVARANLLLYGQQGSALKELLPLLPADQRALAEARMAFRSDARQAPQLFAAVPAALQSDKGLIYERAGYLRRANQPDAALQLAASLPSGLTAEDAASRVWTERRQLINVSLKKGDYRAAYILAANAGMTAPSDIADSEFFAGWLALDKLKEAQTADVHFARIQAAGNSPITQSRALYWRGRAHEAMGDRVGAQAYFAQAA
ncbi:MAG TPA: lytic transglycosylase domain-containing protein, partial [Caulobacteraceae bacterium]|nr:lytic transglycosylase domain-containing protein [Caulobacteraceae bacterium]